MNVAARLAQRALAENDPQLARQALSGINPNLTKKEALVTSIKIDNDIDELALRVMEVALVLDKFNEQASKATLKLWGAAISELRTMVRTMQNGLKAKRV